MPKCVLICDDNPAIAQSLVSYFQEEGIRVITAATGGEALRRIREEAPDAMILDVMLPDISGRDICLEVRKTSNLPILMLSAKGEELDRILGLQIGADDYVTKPFSPHEVFLRTKKLMHRSGEVAAPRVFQLAELTVYPDSFEAYIGEERIRLSAKEFRTLAYLMGHAGNVVTREHIINDVWGIEYTGELRMVDTVITRLRHKLFDARDAVHFEISTVFGVGYKIEETR
jgi:DNA-binding response OmpR family regulator